jgi:DNA-binding FrmR family transcriptional regulator
MPEEIKEGCECCRKKNTPRGEELTRQLRNRINRIIGQMNGIQRMIDENRYCGDVLTQIAAAESALQGLGYLVLKEHMETCVVEEIGKGNTAVVDEAFELMKKLK